MLPMFFLEIGESFLAIKKNNNVSTWGLPIYFESKIVLRNFKKIFELNKYFDGVQNFNMLHLGAYTGHATKWVLDRVSGRAVDVDTWIGSLSSEGHLDNHEIFYSERIENIHDALVNDLSVTKFKGTTKEFFVQNKEKFHFVYIDASHKKEDVAHDLEESFKVLLRGGIIGCDDYQWRTDKDPWNSQTDRYDLIPHEAINEFIAKKSNDLKIIINNYQLWFIKITD